MIYLDNSATTKQAPEVTRRMTEIMELDFGNPSSLHRMGLSAEKAVRTARRQMDEVFPSGGMTVFTSGGTEADNMAILGGARMKRRSGRRIITTAVEHPAVLESFAFLEKECFEVIRIGVDEKGNPDLDALEASVDGETILVSVMQVNNETGTIFPVEEIGESIRKKNPGVLYHCDAVQSFGKIPLPGNADMISVSGHKIHGPKGSGGLWIRKGIHLPPLILGGGQEKAFRSGTENVPAIAGLGLAAEMAAKTQGDALDHMSRLRRILREGLLERIPDTTINGPEEEGTEPGCCCPAILNVSFAGTRGEVILHTLEQEGICVSTGSACSSNKKGQSHVLGAMGLAPKAIEGAIRFSFCRDNTEEEIRETIEKTAQAVERFRRLGSFR